MVMATIIGAHVLLLLALWTQVSRVPPVAVPAMALIAFREPSPPVTAVVDPVPPQLIEVTSPPVANILPDEPVQPPVFDAIAPPAATAAMAGDCAPEAALEAALSTDFNVQSALVNVPASNRSVADAVIIWNATWAELARSRDAPLAHVREVVTDTLRGLSGDCLATPVTGPRLLLIIVPRGTMVLAFGSGTWRWGDISGPVSAAANVYFIHSASTNPRASLLNET